LPRRRLVGRDHLQPAVDPRLLRRRPARLRSAPRGVDVGSSGDAVPQLPRPLPHQELTMTTAFVLSGGGSLGSVQVGMLQALAERAVHPDLLIGTSAGAMNAAYVAGHGTGQAALDDLATIWKRLRRQDVFPFDPLRHLLAVAGSR